MYFDKLAELGIKTTRRSGSDKVKCPQCSDGRKNKHDKPLSVNVTTGEFNCHNCGWKGNVRAYERKRESKNFVKPPQDILRNMEMKESVTKWFGGRGISKETMDKFMIFTREEFMPQTSKKENCICFPYFRDGEMVNIKYRDAHKNFKMVKDAELIFYNLSAIGDKKTVVITEGEIDAMSVYEAGFGKIYDKVDGETNHETGEVEQEENPLGQIVAISVPNGASKGNQRLDYLDNCADWLIGLHEIIIATDADEAGGQLKMELIRRLGVERCKTVSYPIEEVVLLDNGLKRRCKDLNEVLMYLGEEVVQNVINNAQSIPVDGVYYLDDIFESMLDNFRKGVQLAPTTRFREFDEYFRWKKGDITLCTGYGNHGKSFFMLQLMLTKSIWDGWKWAIFSPENFPANDFYDDIIEMYVGKWIKDMTEDEYIDACLFIDLHFFYVYPDDAHDINSIHEKFRHLILKKGVDGVMIDPFNQLDSNQKAYQREDQYLSEVLKDVKRFALLNHVVYTIIAHPKNPNHQSGQPLPIVDVYDIAGGAMWGNKCDQIISYYRPNFHENKNSPEVKVFVQKLKRKRTGGQLGDCDLTLLWAKKRYCNPLTGETPCDPHLAKRGLEKENQDNQKQQSLGYSFDPDEEAPF
jgi:twinkle protein